LGYNSSVPKATLILIAGIAGLWSSYVGLFWGLHAGAQNHSILFVLAWVFPALSVAGVLIYLRWPNLGLNCSWLFLVGALVSYFFMYRNARHLEHVPGGLTTCAMCTLILGTHLRWMFASALCLEFACFRNPIDELVRGPKTGD
jgi:hypothetical protein